MKKKPSLYMVSTINRSIGKTALCLGLALKLKEEGLRVGYFKPVGWKTTRELDRFIDEDALLMKHALNLNVESESLNPICLDYRYLDTFKEKQTDFLEKVKSAYEDASKNMDFMIVESASEPYIGAFMGLSAFNVSKALDSDILFVSSYSKDTAVDEVIFKREYCLQKGNRCLGIVFNRIRKADYDRIKDLFVPFLKARGINVWGVIPDYAPLTAPTIQELVEILGGKVLTGWEGLSNIVENYLIGAMTQESAIRYFRKAPNKAVITGGDRPDIALAALETNTSALILTGNIYPDVRVLAQAGERKIPVILVPYDTYTTVEKIRETTGKIRVGDWKRINFAKKLVAEYLNWEGLLSYFNLAKGR